MADDGKTILISEKTEGISMYGGNPGKITGMCMRFLQLSMGVFILSFSICLCVLTAKLYSTMCVADQAMEQSITLMKSCEASVNSITLQVKSLPSEIRGLWDVNAKTKEVINNMSNSINKYKGKYDKLVKTLESLPVIGSKIQKTLQDNEDPVTDAGPTEK